MPKPIDARIRANTNADIFRIAPVDVLPDGRQETSSDVEDLLTWKEDSGELRREFLADECTPETIYERWGKEYEHFRIWFYDVIESKRVPLGHSGTLRIVEEDGELHCTRLPPPSRSRANAIPLPEGVNSATSVAPVTGVFAGAAAAAAARAAWANAANAQPQPMPAPMTPPVEPPHIDPPAMQPGTFDPMAFFMWAEKIRQQERLYAQQEIDRRERAVRAECQLTIERERLAAEREAKRQSDFYVQMGSLLKEQTKARSQILENETSSLREEIRELRRELDESEDEASRRELIPGAEHPVAVAINGVVETLKPLGPVVVDLLQKKAEAAAHAPATSPVNRQVAG